MFLETFPVTYAYVPSMADELNTSKELLWNHVDTENGQTRRKIYPTAMLSTKNPTYTALGLNPNLRGERPTTVCLSTAVVVCT